MAASCSESPETVTPENKREVQMIPCVQSFRDVQPLQSSRRRALPTGYSLYTLDETYKIGVFFAKDNEVTEGSFANTSGSWRSLLELTNEAVYEVYGFVPREAVGTATIAPNGTYTDGCILTLTGMKPASATDVCIVTGVKQGDSADDDIENVGILPGAFSYTCRDIDTGNYIFLLFDHLYASISFCFKVDAEYDALRTIKVKSMSVVSTKSSTATATVTIAQNTTGDNPISSIVWTPIAGRSEETIFTYEPLDPDDDTDTGQTLTTTLSRVADCMISDCVNSGGGNYLMLHTVYDVYDKKGNLIRADQESDNRIPPLVNVSYNERTKLNVTVKPTYLYQLGNWDLENPEFTVLTE